MKENYSKIRNEEMERLFFEQNPGPKPNWKPQTLCRHEWVYKECKKNMKYLDDDDAPEKIVAEYNRKDMYFCNKCLKEKIVKKHEIVEVGEDLRAIYEPDWY